LKQRTAALGLVGILVAGTAVAAQVVSADPFGQSNPRHKDADSGSIPADLVHTYCITDTLREAPTPDDPEAPTPPPTVERFTAQARLIIHERMRNLDAQTNYQVRYSIFCDSRTDVKFVPGDGGAYGTWNCDAYVPGRDLCARGTLELSQHTLTPEFEEFHGVDGVAQFHKTACHEIGHSVGLGHEVFVTGGDGFDPLYDDCMQSGAFRKDPPRTYNAHHVAHINSRTPAAN
jgi:hypothetical protein